MAKPMGPRCNVDCQCCSYLLKEKLCPDEKRFRMSEEALERHLRDYIAASVRPGQRSIEFAWQGIAATIARA